MSTPTTTKKKLKNFTKNKELSDLCLEVCCEASIENTLSAFRGGARRVELCASLKDGGTTPSIGSISIVSKAVKSLKKSGKISKASEIHVMIRPRGGDFVYSPEEVSIMVENIKAIKRMDVHGVVFGCLSEDGTIDVDILNVLVQSAKPELRITFHRAFDMCISREKSLDVLMNVGVDRVLTSGGHRDAMAGVKELARLRKRVEGHGIIIAAGAGVNQINVNEILRQTNLSHVHASSACMKIVESRMKYRNNNVMMGVKSEEYFRKIVCEEKVRALISKMMMTMVVVDDDAKEISSNSSKRRRREEVRAS